MLAGYYAGLKWAVLFALPCPPWGYPSDSVGVLGVALEVLAA